MSFVDPVERLAYSRSPQSNRNLAATSIALPTKSLPADSSEFVEYVRTLELFSMADARGACHRRGVHLMSNGFSVFSLPLEQFAATVSAKPSLLCTFTNIRVWELMDPDDDDCVVTQTPLRALTGHRAEATAKDNAFTVVSQGPAALVELSRLTAYASSLACEMCINDHPNIVPLSFLGLRRATSGPGGSLDPTTLHVTEVRRDGFASHTFKMESHASVKKILVDILCAMVAAHRAGVVLRLINPFSLSWSSCEHCFQLNTSYGCARVSDNPNIPQHRQSGRKDFFSPFRVDALLVTGIYNLFIPPEMAANHHSGRPPKTWDVKADAWALGMTLLWPYILPPGEVTGHGSLPQCATDSYNEYLELIDNIRVNITRAAVDLGLTIELFVFRALLNSDPRHRMLPSALLDVITEEIHHDTDAETTVMSLPSINAGNELIDSDIVPYCRRALWRHQFHQVKQSLTDVLKSSRRHALSYYLSPAAEWLPNDAAKSLLAASVAVRAQTAWRRRADLLSDNLFLVASKSVTLREFSPGVETTSLRSLMVQYVRLNTPSIFSNSLLKKANFISRLPTQIAKELFFLD